jgi:transposase
MNYVGIDIGKKRHAANGIGERGEVVLGARFVTADAGGYGSLTGDLHRLGTKPTVLIGMESTGHYGKLLAHRLREDGWTVNVFNPAVIAFAAKGDLRGRKSDKLDARVIAQVLREGKRGETQALSADEEKLKMLCRQRNFVVGQRTGCKNHLMALLDVLFPELMGFFHAEFSPSMLAVAGRFPSAVAVAGTDVRTLTSVLHAASRGKLGLEEAQTLKKTARTSLARTRTNDGEEAAARQTVQMIRFLDEQIKGLEQQMQACSSPIATCLASIKGAGKILPLMIAGELGNLERFQAPNMAQRILAFAGSEPRIQESGKWQGHFKMSKRGSTTLRCALFQMANTVRLHSPAFDDVYNRQIARHKHHSVALSHVIRAIVNTLCGMHKTKTLYRTPETRKVS